MLLVSCETLDETVLLILCVVLIVIRALELTLSEQNVHLELVRMPPSPGVFQQSLVDARSALEGDAVLLQHDSAGTGKRFSKLSDQIANGRRLPISTTALIRIVVLSWPSRPAGGMTCSARRAEMQLDPSAYFLTAHPAPHTEFQPSETREGVAVSADGNLLILLDLAAHPFEQAS